MRRLCVALIAVCAFASASYGVDFNRRAYSCPYTNDVFVSILQRIGRGKKDYDQGDSRTRYNPTSFSVGYVHDVERWYAGASFNYETGSRKLTAVGDNKLKISTSMPGIALFGGITDGYGAYVDASMFFGFASFKGKDLRLNGVNIPGSDTDHKTMFALGLEAGKRFDFGHFGGLGLTPHVGIDYAYAPTERYRTGGLTGSIDSQSYFEIPFGVTISKDFVFGGLNVTPKLDLTVVTSLGKMDPYNEHPGFAYRTAKGWKVAGISAGRIGGRITAGVDSRLSDRMKVGFDYAFEGRSRYQDHRLSANFAFSF